MGNHLIKITISLSYEKIINELPKNRPKAEVIMPKKTVKKEMAKV